MKLDSNKTPTPGGSPAVGQVAAQPDPHARLISLLLGFVTVLVYLPAGFFDFVNFDDVDYVTANPVVQDGLTWAGFKWAFIGWHASNWHPLTWLSHELDCQLFGLNAGAHHLVSVLFHAANTVLLFQLWLRLTGARWPSAVVAALFAWHPLHVESVAWVAERKDVLSTFFGLLATLAYVSYARDREVWGGPAEARHAKTRGRSSFFLSLICFALALLAKPMLVTLPCVWLLLDYWPLERLPGGRQLLAKIGPLIREKWPFLALSAASCILTSLAQQSAERTLDEDPLGLRLENVVVAYAGYLGKILWPARLCIFYPLNGNYSAAQLMVAALVLAGLSAAVWRWRDHRYLVTGWLWFLGTLVPVIGLVQVGAQAMADRYMYLPAVGVFVALVFAGAEALAVWKIPARVPGGLTVLALAACVAVTEHQLRYWRNSIALFEHAVAITKHNGMGEMMLGSAYESAGRDEDARRAFHAALEIFATIFVKVDGGEQRPLAAQVELLLGQAAEQKGQAADAIAHYREVLRLDSRVVEAHNNLGNLLEEQGKADEALAEYRAAVGLKPNSALVHDNLGTQLLNMGRFDEAMAEYQVAARQSSTNPQPAYLMGKAWLRTGQSARAVLAFQSALRLSTNDCPSLVWLARVLAADQNAGVRDGAQAVALAEQASQLTGGAEPEVLGTLAMAYAESGRFNDASNVAQTALGLAAGGKPAVIADLQAQLRLYAAGQPFRESFSNPPARN